MALHPQSLISTTFTPMAQLQVNGCLVCCWYSTNHSNSAHDHCCLLDSGRVSHKANATMGRNGKGATVRRKQSPPGLHIAKPPFSLHSFLQEPPSSCRVDAIRLLSAQGLDRYFYRRVYAATSTTSATTINKSDGAIPVFWPQCIQG
jgi:hypothetical protein